MSVYANDGIHSIELSWNRRRRRRRLVVISMHSDSRHQIRETLLKKMSTNSSYRVLCVCVAGESIKFR